MTGPLRLVHVGAGNMGREWIKVAVANPDVEVVGIVDVDAGTAARGGELVPGGVVTGHDLRRVARESGADAVIDVTIPAAHHPVTTESLFLGLPVLGEKPVAATVAEALSLAAASEVTGRLFMVSQSRRYHPQVAAARRLVGEVGGAGIATCEFFRAPRFGGFREEMDDVLLVDMAVHAFDGIRWMSGQDPVSVYCESFNPGWSWYRGDAVAVATFAFADGARFSYTGSWCSPGFETSWNGIWRFSGPGGTVLWSGDEDPVAESTAGEPIADAGGSEPEGLAGALEAFVSALRTGNAPHGEVHENVMSLVMVEAALESKATGRRVTLADVLDRAHTTALTEERHPEVRERLRSWTTPADALAHPAEHDARRRQEKAP